jgi:hypothetical protein
MPSVLRLRIGMPKAAGPAFKLAPRSELLVSYYAGRAISVAAASDLSAEALHPLGAVS